MLPGKPKGKIEQTNITLFGKVPPQDIELETAVLGALILEGGPEKGKLISILKDWMFYREAHRQILIAIQELYLAGAPVDILTVTAKLREMKTLEAVGGPYYITTLTNRVVSSDNTEYHIRLLQQYGMRRQLIQIANNCMNAAFDESVDVFDLIDKTDKEINAVNVSKGESVLKGNRNVSQVVGTMMNAPKSSSIQLYYQTGWKRFDSLVSLGANKIVLVAGGAKMGKTRFVSSMFFRMLETYKDMSILWVTLEDSAEDIVIHFLSSKVYVKGKDIKKKNFSSTLMPFINSAMDIWSTFDIEFVDKTLNIKTIGTLFKIFCSKRLGRFCALVIDNILSLNDRVDMKNELNSFYDYVMNEVLSIRQETKGLIVPVHHFRDAQQDKENLKEGYRPRLTDMKGTEAFRRVPNQVLLINTPGKYKDLLSEYKGDMKENLKKMFIVDVGASREDDNVGETDGVIHMLSSLDYNVFQEVDYYDPTQGMEGKNVYFAPIDPEVLANEKALKSNDPPF